MSKKTTSLLVAGVLGLGFGLGTLTRTKPEKAAQGNAVVFALEDGGVVDLSEGVHKIRRVKPSTSRPDGGSGKREDLFRFGKLMCDRALLKTVKTPAEACWHLP